MIEQSKERIGQLIDYWTAKAKWHERWPEGQGLAAEALARIYADTVSSLHRLAEPPNSDPYATIKSLCDRLERINQHCYVENMTPQERLMLIERISGGFMTPPPAPGTAPTKEGMRCHGKGHLPLGRGEKPLTCPDCASGYDANGSPVEPPDCPHCAGFEVDGTVLHGPRCPEVETGERHE